MREVSFLDRVFAGRVIRDFGIITERSLGVGKMQTSLLLVERGGANKLVFKTAAWAFLGGSVSYVDIPVEEIPRLQQWIGEAQALLASGAAR